MTDRTAHAITAACADDHCYWHEADEDDAGAYRRCFECKHVYPDGQALTAAYNEGAAELNRREPDEPAIPPETDPGRIAFCPLCMHDF